MILCLIIGKNVRGILQIALQSSNSVSLFFFLPSPSISRCVICLGSWVLQCDTLSNVRVRYSDNFEKYFRKFHEILSKKISSKIFENFEEYSLTMYYNGLVTSHRCNVNFLEENDGTVVGNFRYTRSQVSFVYVCVCVFLHLCVYTDNIK